MPAQPDGGDRPTTPPAASSAAGWTLTSTVAMTTLALWAIRRQYVRSNPRRPGLHDLDLKGRTVVVTGANTGIGKETARQLHAMNASVILACRDVEAAQLVADELTRSARADASRNNHSKRLLESVTPTTGNVTAMELDVASFESIKRFAAEIERSGRPVHVLVNNAGIMSPKFERVGFVEKQFMTNFLGPFALTLRLLPVLARSGTLAAPARVVNVSSRLEKKGSASFFAPEAHEDTVTQQYSSFKAYGTSKLANIMFSNELERLCRANGLHVTSTAVTPGMIPGTDLGRDMTPPLVRAMLRPLGWLIFRSTAEGALSSVWAASAPELSAVGAGGRFLDYHKPGMDGGASAQSSDAEAAARLWRQSVKATGVSCALLERTTPQSK